MDERRPLRVGVWCAVSSKAQAADDKVSLEDQERQGRELAAAVGGEVVAVYRVPGHTRDIIFYTDAEAAMPAYAELHRDVEAGALDLLWGVDIDRLGRDPALGQQVVSLVEKNGGEVYLASAPHPIGHKTAAHRYITAIQSVRAGEDQAQRTHKLQAGMRGRIEKRGLLAGSVPFYLDVVRDERTGEVVGYEFNDRARALDLMTDLFLAGHSYAEIQRRMEASVHPPPRGRRWWHYSILKFLSSDVPAGFAQWGAFRSAEPSPLIPRRWDDETFAAVIRERDRRSRPGFSRRGSSAFKGVAKCARCGSDMTRMETAAELADGQTATYAYLRCGRHALRSIYADFACHANYLPESRVREALSAFLQEVLAGPEVVDAALAALDRGAGEQERLRADLAGCEAVITDLERRRVRLAHALAGGSMDVRIYRQADDDLLAQAEAEKMRRAYLARALESVPDPEQVRRGLRRLAGEFGQLVDGADPAEVAAILQAVPLRVFCESGQVVRIEAG